MRLDPVSNAARSLTRAIVASAAAAGCAARIVASSEQSWASATYVGARHRIVIAIPACIARYHWLAGLAEAELPMRGHVALPPAILSADDDTVELEVLTLEDH